MEVLPTKKRIKITTCIMVTLVFTLSGCNQYKNKVIVQESETTVTVVEDETQKADEIQEENSTQEVGGMQQENKIQDENKMQEESKIQEDNKIQEANETEISVQKVERFEKVAITDWLDENTVIASKENESLGKMSLAELSDQYPESLYLLDISSKEYQLVKEQKDVSLGGAVFSQDKKFLLYQEYVLGDSAFFVMNLDNKESFGFVKEPIGGARSAHWVDNNTVIGSAYSGGAYLTDRTGNINLIDDLNCESLFLVERIDNVIYYNTQTNFNLMKLDLDTKEKTSLNLDQVYEMLLSPDNKQMLIKQTNGSKDSILVYDLLSGEKVIIAEGTELNGASWSPDQKMIAYSMKEEGNSSNVRSLFVYDLITGKSTKIAENTQMISANWSPSGEKISYLERNGEQYISNIIYIK